MSFEINRFKEIKMDELFNYQIGNISKTKDYSNLNFQQLLDKTDEKIRIADEIAYKFAEGKDDIPIHTLMISAEEARLHIQLLCEVRNKLVDSYHELVRTAG